MTSVRRKIKDKNLYILGMSLKLILGMVAIVLIIIGGMGGSDKLKRQILRHSEVEKIF